MDKEQIKIQVGNNIRKYRELNNMSTLQLITELNSRGLKVDKSYISKWENGVVLPTINVLFEICNILNVELAKIYGEKSDELGIDEEQLVSLYRKLDERKKDVLKDVAKSQLSLPTENRIVALKLLNEPACAGNGNYISSQDYEVVEFSNPPITAKFAVRAQGNSMQPMINDGDILFVNPDIELSNGDIAIVTYQGNTFVKQIKKLNNNLVLHSLNPAYSDITITEPEEFFYNGRVL